MNEQKDNLNESAAKPSESIVVMDADSPACQGMAAILNVLNWMVVNVFR